MALTAKRRAFCRKIVKNKGNAVKSYQEAGFKGSYNVAGVESHRLLKNPKIKKEIERLVKKEIQTDILTADQVLSGLTDIAAADIAEVLEPDGSFNLANCKARGKSKLIKSLKYDKDGKITGIELYSAHEGQRDLGKFHKLFTERVETADLTEENKALREYLRLKVDRLMTEGKSDNDILTHFAPVFDQSSAEHSPEAAAIIRELIPQPTEIDATEASN